MRAACTILSIIGLNNTYRQRRAGGTTRRFAPTGRPPCESLCNRSRTGGLDDTTPIQRRHRLDSKLMRQRTTARRSPWWSSVRSPRCWLSWSRCEEHGFTFIQYFILSWQQDAAALYSKNISARFRPKGDSLTHDQALNTRQARSLSQPMKASAGRMPTAR